MLRRKNSSFTLLQFHFRLHSRLKIHTKCPRQRGCDQSLVVGLQVVTVEVLIQFVITSVISSLIASSVI